MSDTKNKILNALNIYTPLVRENFKKTFPAANNISISGGTFNFDSETGVANISIPAAESIDTSTFVTAVSLQGAGSASIDSGTLNISIPAATAENFSVNGTEVTAMSVTGAASVSFANDTAVVSVQSADSFIINNQTVSAASISGADVTFDNGVANISLTGATAENFSVNGTEVTAMSVTGAQISFDNGVANISISSAPQKLNPELTLSTENVVIETFAQANNTTLTATATSDGLLAWQSFGDIFSIDQLQADTFRIIPAKKGTATALFSIPETAKYYSAQKKLNVTSNFEFPDFSSFKFDDNFNDEADWEWTVQGDNYQFVEGHKDGVKAVQKIVKLGDPITLIAPDNIFEFTDSWTVHYWLKSEVGDYTAIGFQMYFGDDYLLQNRISVNTGTGCMNSIKDKNSESSKHISASNSGWHHCANVYDVSTQTLNYYFDGSLSTSWGNLTFDKCQIKKLVLSPVTSNQSISSLFVFDGLYIAAKALWTGNFTPPNQ